MAYTVATQLTAGDQSKFYASIVADIVCFVARDLTHSAGGFFSAEDADSCITATNRNTASGQRARISAFRSSC